MIRSLYTAASGMTAQQLNVDNISNNLANVNTVGFKKSRTDFEDLIYQSLRTAGTPKTINTDYPTGIEVGLGVKPSATRKIYTMGKPQQTERPFDACIFGDGFFKIRMGDGNFAYTRNGVFEVDSNGDIVTANGDYLEPPIRLDLDFLPESVKISDKGLVSYRSASQAPDEPDRVAGVITLHRFVNPAGLKNIGDNLVVETAASGIAFEGESDTPGYGKIKQGYVEMSNVEIVEEMTNMIVAQRAYEFNSRAIHTSDSMLATAVHLKR